MKCFALVVEQNDNCDQIYWYANQIKITKKILFPIFLGIFLLGIVITPAVFAGEGCGEGTVLVDGVCELAKTSGTSMSIEQLYIVIGVVAIGGIIGAIAVARRGSKTSKPAKQDLEEYEEKYLAKQKPAKQKPAEKKETSSSCSNCGKPLKPTAKFCGECGTPRS